MVRSNDPHCGLHQISTTGTSQALCLRWEFPDWSQEATERSFEGNIFELLCNNNKPLFKKTQGEEPESSQTSLSRKWVIERDFKIPRLLDLQLAFYMCLLSIALASDLPGVQGTASASPSPCLCFSLSVCIFLGLSLSLHCFSVSVFRSLPPPHIAM